MTTPKELYTPASFATLGGSTFLVTIVADLVRTKLGWDPWWVALVFSELLAAVGLAVLPRDHWQRWGKGVLLVVAFCNGLLIYSQATGINAIRTGIPSSSSKEATFLPFFDPVAWWPPAEQTKAARDAAEALSNGAQEVAQVAAVMTDLRLPIREEILSLQHDLEGIRQNRVATLRDLQNPSRTEAAALGANLARLEASEREAVATLDKLGAAESALDPAVMALSLRSVRNRLSESEGNLTKAAGRLNRTWGPVWQSALFKPAGVLPSTRR